MRKGGVSNRGSSAYFSIRADMAIRHHSPSILGVAEIPGQRILHRHGLVNAMTAINRLTRFALVALDAASPHSLLSFRSG